MELVFGHVFGSKDECNVSTDDATNRLHWQLHYCSQLGTHSSIELPMFLPMGSPVAVGLVAL